MTSNLKPPVSNGLIRQVAMPLTFSGCFLLALVASGLLPLARAGGGAADPNAGRRRLAAAGESCASATVINPASLPFTDESSTIGALNDVDPNVGGCVTAPGPDVVYSFTPSATDTYTIGATPSGPFAVSFNLNVYLVTDCSNASGTCVAGADVRSFGDGEFITPSLTAGTRYFIVVDSPSAAGQGAFHFSLRRGLPSNDSCSTPTIIDPTRLPVTVSGTTFGAANDSNPGTPCLPKGQSGAGSDVVYQITSNDSQLYDVTVTPLGNYDVSVYSVTNCATSGGCSGADVHGAGVAETLRTFLAEGTTYFIVVDGFGGDAGDFTLSIVPTIPHTPAAPTNLAAHPVSSTEIDLTWQDNSSNEAGFRVERGLDGATFTEITQTAPSVSMFHDTGLTPLTTYFYRVFAFNNFGNSAASNIAADTTLAAPVPQFPVIIVDPQSVDFGSVQILQSATRTVNVSNGGGLDLIINSITDPTGNFSIVDKPAVPLTIHPADSIDLTVRFAPLAATTLTGSFVIGSNDPMHPNVTVDLSGVGVGTPVPDMTITPSFIDFPGGSSVRLVTIESTGGADLLVGNIQPPKAPFSLSGLPAFPALLKPGESFHFFVNFSPNAPGAYQGIMIILDNDPDQQFLSVRMQGTSTPQNELLKLRAPAFATAVTGSANTFNVIAVNGANSNITLSASPITGGVFTDRGNGRGDLVFTPPGVGRDTAQVTFMAHDTNGGIKTVIATITIVPPAEKVDAQISFTPPDTASNPPTNLQVVDMSITPLSVGSLRPLSGGQVPFAAAGLAGYVIYKSNQPGQAPSLGAIAAVLPASAVSITDPIPIPADTSFLSSSVFYVATAIYSSGTESSASNQSSTGPNLVNLQYKKKQIRFQRAKSNVERDAVLVVDGQQTFNLQADGDLIIVPKKGRSTPGNLRPKDIFSSGSHTVQVRNPHGQVSVVVTLSK